MCNPVINPLLGFSDMGFCFIANVNYGVIFWMILNVDAVCFREGAPAWVEEMTAAICSFKKVGG